ncbi:MAG: UDP-N-acetylmuramoyl-L-alanyl-D-glutamate--2,6-diaminopimelate ligase [Christensenellaceae bacterium]|jgi:UDP-N-acetylmuramoyl-L-alanyl-D-glutamate--2,6-diaminopimelate ligase
MTAIYELTKHMNCRILGDKRTIVSDVCYDSRKVKKGDLFFCIEGYSVDGHDYAPDAVKNGAAALVCMRELPINVPQVIVADSREAMALMSARFFGYPAKRLKMAGVTGTNGKTTTTYMIKAIAERAGMKVGLVGTIVNMIGKQEVQTERTTPESLDLQRLLRRMVDEGCEMAVMEVSSHSLQLKRVFGIEFDVGVFTNLTQDHLDFHQTWDAYVKAKSMLFEQSRVSIINIDDDSAAHMMGAAGYEVVKYSVTHPADYYAEDIQISSDATDYRLMHGSEWVDIHVNIPGVFTVYNSLAAATACYALGIDQYYIELGLREMKPVLGRFEVLDTRGQGYTVILDYAHTPDSMKNTLSAIKRFAPARIVTLFGCGGNRDASKRPIMAHIADEYSDYTIITSDNPRYEEPEEIIKQAEAGIKDTGAEYTCIENRRDAIRYALENAQKEDIILLAGKGHETYQEIKGVKHDFDEKVVVQEILDELGIQPKR